jgi:23S rRNA (uracil-5-)-methyltransferase RumA
MPSMRYTVGNAVRNGTATMTLDRRTTIRYNTARGTWAARCFSSAWSATVPPLSNKQLRAQIVNMARSGEATTPRCRHAPPPGECGGCTFQAVAYADQVRAKHAALRDLWAAVLPPEQLDNIGFVQSPDPFAYRTRMDYVASKGRFGLRRGGKFNYIVELGECHLLPPTAFVAARAAYEQAIALGLPDYNLRSHEGFLRYIVVRRSPQDSLLLAFVTAAPDDAGRYEAALNDVAETVLAAHPAVVGICWLVNDSLTDISFGRPQQHWGHDRLAMAVGERTLEIGPNTFFQNNVHLLLPLLEDVKEGIREVQPPLNPPKVADLYGGVGTIALHIADAAARVVCVESVEESANLARYNIAANNCANVDAVHADVLPFLRAQPAGAFDVIMADPPRVGLGPEVCAELLRLAPRRLVYVSCNPLTQLDDARALMPVYQLVRLTGYDMFPQTPHLEALAVFDQARQSPESVLSSS